MYKKILVPIATDHEGTGATAMAIAESLLDDDGRIVILHVLEALPGFVETYMPEEIFTRNRTDALERLGKMAAKSEREVSVEVVTGHSGRTIINYATSRDCDCIVMPSHKPELSDYMFGSTAAWVVRHAPCSLHVLR